MPVGGTPARQRAAITLSVGGAVVGSFVFAQTQCQPIPPDSPPQPQPVVDVEIPEVEPDAEPEPTEECQFVSPRTRGGKRKQTRIVGGTPATPGAFPFAAGIANSSGFQYCGGSVIGDRFVLTAAHCQVEAGDRVLVGSTDLSKARQVAIVESRIHPRFSSDTLDYDVAIAKLGSDAGVPAVGVADGVLSLDATVIGWGAVCEGCSGTQHLREVSIPLWEFEQCAEAYSGLTHRQVCAGVDEGGKDSCQGDSGGALLTWNIDRWEQLGIVSWGVGCARPGAPGVYSDLRAHELRRWVEACSK
jgi:secreted trypsin-like serine protease